MKLSTSRCACALPVLLTLLTSSIGESTILTSGDPNLADDLAPLHEKLLLNEQGERHDAATSESSIDESREQKISSGRGKGKTEQSAEERGSVTAVDQQDVADRGEVRKPVEPSSDTQENYFGINDIDQHNDSQQDFAAAIGPNDELTNDNYSASLIDTVHITKAENIVLPQKEELANPKSLERAKDFPGNTENASYDGSRTNEQLGEDNHTSNKAAEDENIEANSSETLHFSAEYEDEDDHHVKYVNYAHKNAGAIILSNSPSFKGTSNLLVSDNDKYAIAPCADKKSVVISLSEDILVKEIVLSNFEKYSSSVKEFQILGSQDYDASKPNAHWHDLGTYIAQPTTGGEEKFTLREPSWARYLKFRFLTHYGHEHYCTVTQIKVQGSTMVQGFHEQWKESEKELEELRGVMSSDNEIIDNQEENYILSDGAVNILETEVAGVDSIETDEVAAIFIESNKSDSFDHAESGVTAKRILEQEEHVQNASSAASVITPSLDDAEHDTKHKEHVLSTERTALDELQPEVEAGHEGRVPMNLNAMDELTEKSSVVDATFGSKESQHLIELNANNETTLSEAFTASEIKRVNQTASSIRSEQPAPNNAALSDEDLVVIENLSNSNASIESVKKPYVADQVTQYPTATSRDSEDTVTSRSNYSLSETSNVENMLSEDQPVQHLLSEVDCKVKSERNAEPQKTLASEEELKVAIDSNAKESSVPTFHQRESLSESNKGIAAFIEKYASAKCLQSLNLHEFKSKFQPRATKVKASGDPGGSSTTTSLKIEPIFKTLTDEIKALQVHTSIYDQYIVDMTSCYQQVLMAMVAEIQQLEKIQFIRMISIEKELEDIRRQQESSASDILQLIITSLNKARHIIVKWCSLSSNVLLLVRETITPHICAACIVTLTFCIILVKALSWKSSHSPKREPPSDTETENHRVECDKEGSSCVSVKPENSNNLIRIKNYGKKSKSKKYGKRKLSLWL